MTILLATKNAHKVREYQHMCESLSVTIEMPEGHVTLPDIEEDQDTFLGNAKKKAVQTAKVLNRWVLADDSGLMVDAINGQPGIYSARFSGAVENRDLKNNEKLLNMLSNVPENKRTAQFVCVIVLANSNGDYWHVQGICSGRILDQMQGAGGFGYDPLFWVESHQTTFAQLSLSEKSQISHRGQALAQMRTILVDLF